MIFGYLIISDKTNIIYESCFRASILVRLEAIFVVKEVI